VCNKLWYGIESISSSHSASSQLSGEFMLLHSIHTLANLALKETVPPSHEPHRTSLQKIIFNTANSGHSLFFRASASCSKILNGKQYIEYSENFEGKLSFSRQAQVAQKSWIVKTFSVQYIECIFTWGDPCNLG